MSTLGQAWFRKRNPLLMSTILLAAALVTWIVTVQRMRGMDAGPGTDLGGLGWFLGVWVTMMAAMMLPSAAPMLLLFHRMSSERRQREQSFAPTSVFVLGYLAVWTAYGLAAYGLDRLVIDAGSGFLAWNRGGPYIAGAALVMAGSYELTPLKSVCLRHCRSPLHFIFGRWREGRIGAIRMGTEHGAYCVGCCWGLMIVLFALGVMSLLWMAVVATLIFAQKVLPGGVHLTRVFAVGFISAGIWIASAPTSVPGLTQPNAGAAMRSLNAVRSNSYRDGFLKPLGSHRRTVERQPDLRVFRAHVTQPHPEFEASIGGRAWGLGQPSMDKATGRIELPLHIRWSGPPITYDLTACADRARVTNRSSGRAPKTTWRFYVEADQLLELWDELVLPPTVRRAWAAWLRPHRRAG